MSPGFASDMREACVEFQARDLDAKAIRADDAQEMRLCRSLHALGQIARDAGRDDDSRFAAFTAELINDAGYRIRRRGNDGEARYEGEGLNAAVTGLAQDIFVAWIDETDFAREAAAQKVFRNMQPDGTGPLARPHKNDAARLKQEIEVPDGHVALHRPRFGCSAPATPTPVIAYRRRERKDRPEQ